MTSSGGEGYFENLRRGEVEELLSQLQTNSVQSKDKKKYRDAVSRVVSYMTLGVDVSRLFPQMVMACNTQDLVQKKLVYLYLCNYAELKPDLALLCINTLTKDAGNDNPKIRGLAVRSLSSLRLPRFCEYFLPAIDRALDDVAPYVRQTAVMAAAKLLTTGTSGEPGLNGGERARLIERLRSKVTEREDAGVLVNVLLALEELARLQSGDSGGGEPSLAVDRGLAVLLVNRLFDFNEWGLALVLGWLGKYAWPTDELYTVMNTVEPCFRHANSAVVLAASRLFMRFSDRLPAALLPQILVRVRTPLITLTEGGYDELAYVLLGHCDVLLQRDGALFEHDYRALYIRHNDPLYLKEKKIQLLVSAATPRNVHDLVTELSDYVMDPVRAVGVRAVQAMTSIAVKLPASADHVVHNLLTIFRFDVEHLTVAVVAAFKDILRCSRDHAAKVVAALGPLVIVLEAEKARAALVWMLGEFGEHLPDAPYLLEVLVEDYERQSPRVKLQLLTAALRLFFKFPAVVKPWLGQLFESSLNDAAEVQVHDRALFYWRLLTTNVAECARVVASSSADTASGRHHHQLSPELVDMLFDEFNSLSVVFRKPYAEWRHRDIPYAAFQQPEKPPRRFVPIESTSTIPPSSTISPSSTIPPSSTISPSTSTISPSTQSIPTQSIPTISPSTSTIPPSQSIATQSNDIQLELEPIACLSGADFERLWHELPDSGVFELTMSSERDLPPAGDFEQALSPACFFTVASGVIEQLTKIYLYAVQRGGAVVCLVEMILDGHSRVLRTTFKCSDAAYHPHFLLAFQRALATL